MFTGLIEAIGKILKVHSFSKGRRLTIACRGFSTATLKLGESVAVSGVCLTVIEKTENYFIVELSSETVNLTTLGSVQEGTAVNLERALLPTTRLGGHFVSGHVDGLGQIVNKKIVEHCLELSVQLPPELVRFVAKKGSITIEGVSLTVNEEKEGIISLMIIPHTLEQTTLGTLSINDRVNIEVDLLARYLESLLSKQEDKCSSIN